MPLVAIDNVIRLRCVRVFCREFRVAGIRRGSARGPVRHQHAKDGRVATLQLLGEIEKRFPHLPVTMRDDGDRLWRRRSPLQKPSTSVPASSTSRLVDFEDLKAQLRQLPGTTDTQLFGRLEWPLYRPLTEKSDRGKVRKGAL